MNQIDKFEPRRLGKKQIYKEIEEFIKESGCEVLESNENSPFETFSIKTPDGTIFVIHIYAKNISGAGWADKPEIKRIQINKLPEIPRQRKEEFYILCGLCKYSQETVMATWDPMNYTTHNTNCSCYVFVSSLEKAINMGMFHGLNKGKEVMTCTRNGFNDLLVEISSRYR